jgi:hypothetical protein
MRFSVCRAISPAADDFMASVNRRATRPSAATDVKVRVLDGQAVSTAWGSFTGGDTFATSDKQARRLVELGIVEVRSR